MSKYCYGIKNSTVTITNDIFNTTGATTLSIRSNTMSFTPASAAQLTASYSFVVGNGFTYASLLNITHSSITSSKPLSITDSTSSSSASTGALIVTGGVGIGGSIYMTGTTTCARFSSTASGSVSAPIFTFSAETTKGMYSPGTNQLGLAVNSSNCLNINANTANKTYINIGRATTTSPASAVGDGNYLVFNGTFDDSTGSYGIVAERIYGLSESSEILLWKGNDVAGASGPDRIRCRAAAFVVQTFSTSETMTLPTVNDNNTRFSIDSTSVTVSLPLVVSSNLYYGSLTTALSANTTLVVSDSATGGKYKIPLNSGSTFTVTLPSTTGNDSLSFIFVNRGAGIVTITTNNTSTEYFNGNSAVTTISMSQYDTLTVICDSTNWYIV